MTEEFKWAQGKMHQWIRDDNLEIDKDAHGYRIVFEGYYGNRWPVAQTAMLVANREIPRQVLPEGETWPPPDEFTGSGVDFMVYDNDEPTTTRSNILDTAKQYVTTDRAASHGDAEDNFARIAGFWSVYLGQEIKPADVAVMMMLLKSARLMSNPANADNWIDAAGYAACGGEIAASKD